MPVPTIAPQPICISTPAMYNQAIACYDKIISFQPDASDAFSLRGWAKIAVGDFDNGIERFAEMR